MSNFENGKRVTIKLKCPNPLFEEWIITWRDQAAEKNSKLQYIFNHALNSLRKYPLTLATGRECKILKGFGDKLCKMLDDKLNDYQKNYENIRITSVDETSKTNNKKSKKPVDRIKTLTSGNSKKQYIPQHGSGGYAILVTLYIQGLQPTNAGFLKKAEIIQYGKDLTNTSFTKPDPGSRYTAWSSMRTLLEKKLVSKVSHPPKFSLTEEGILLARKLHENSETNSASSTDEYSNTLSSVKCNFENITTDSYSNSKSYDIVNIPEEFTNEFFEDHWNPTNDTFSVNLADIEGSLRDTNFDSHKVKNIPSSNIEHESEPNIQMASNHCIMDKVIPLNLNVQPSSKKSTKKIVTSSSVSSEIETVESDFLFQHKNKKTIQKYSTNTVSTICLTDDVQSSSKCSLKKYNSSSSVASTKSNVGVSENFIMAPNSFDIILYVDTNETSGSSKNENDEVLLGLKQSGIKYEVQNLKVGDFTWICRDRISDKELVLPYIAERKRMDDFAHSIKDRRYQEQKFRLKKSGIENLTYLVESHGRNEHLGLPLQTLCQAATNTAIQEKFFVKFTENLKESVDYLVNFSRILIKMFKSKTLASCPKADLQPVDINSDLVALISFQEFNESSVKNKRMKVADLFVKMLIQIKGMSVEKALAITQKYPTPLLLKMAYDKNPDSICEKLLSNIKHGAYGKSLGVVLSKTVYQAFCKTQY